VTIFYTGDAIQLSSINMKDFLTRFQTKKDVEEYTKQLEHELGLKGLGVWIGLAFALFVAAISMCWRFYHLSREQ